MVARQTAQNELLRALHEMLDVELRDPEIRLITDFEPKVFGLDVPERLIKQVGLAWLGLAWLARAAYRAGCTSWSLT